MIVDLNSGKEINNIPHAKHYDLIRNRLSAKEYDAIIEELNKRIDETTGEVVTSSWIPGANWNGTAFQAIYDKAANENFDLAGLFFGLIVWVVFKERPEKWTYVKYSDEESGIRGTTYFKYER